MPDEMMMSCNVICVPDEKLVPYIPSLPRLIELKLYIPSLPRLIELKLYTFPPSSD